MAFELFAGLVPGGLHPFKTGGMAFVVGETINFVTVVPALL
jgi:hypothetical protein